jgi:two-component system, OmpR family, sensor histidine kinase KdpD
MSDRRPDPDLLLAQVRDAEARVKRGKLKVFFGANPGVGKTFAMLEEARVKRAEGMDVVVGIVETHRRVETEALLPGLEVLPRRRVEYRGVVLHEFDLDAALARHPAILLVDELAHTNAPDSRHTRRWQDVEELLDAGISVYTTLNVQHLESLNDVVAQITGIQVRETVPDAVFDAADEVELADLTPDDLLRRLEQGKVYFPEQAQRAREEFFRKGNLIALRELALRRVAERVDAQMRGYMREQGIREIWPAGDRLLVSIGPNPASARLIRAGHRMASRLDCEWVVVYVENPAISLSSADREALVENLRVAEELEARVATLQGRDTADEILAYAREHNVTRIIVGKPTHPRWRDKVRGSLLDKLVRGSGDVDVYVISGEVEGDVPRRPPSPSRVSPLKEYLWAALVVTLCSLAGWAAFRHFTVTDIAMIYLLGTVVVSSRSGRGPALAAVFVSIALFDFFFVPPYLTFAVSDLQFVSTFGVMLVISLVISGLTVRVREQAGFARERESRTAALYAMSRELTTARDRSQLVDVVRRQIGASFGAAVQLLLPDEAGSLAPLEGQAPTYSLDDRERGVAQWVFQRDQSAGLGTDTLPAARALYLPLRASGHLVGVLGVMPSDPRRFQGPAQRQLLEAFADQVALALERMTLERQTQQTQVEIEAERLRTALLSSLSHDLRTPLAGITGSATSLLQDRSMRDEVRRDLLQTIVEEAQRMNRLIGNLLDMIRVETQTLVVQKEWQPLEEPIGVALIRLDERLQGREVQVQLPPDLPLVPLDGLLIEEVLINLLENAVKYTPAGSPITISARADNETVTVDVADRGPGLPPGEEARIFEKFYRSVGAPPGGGVGLGLTICRGIVQAHGGRIWAENRPNGGAVFRFTLPIEGTPPALPPREVAAESA